MTKICGTNLCDQCLYNSSAYIYCTQAKGAPGPETQIPYLNHHFREKRKGRKEEGRKGGRSNQMTYFSLCLYAHQFMEEAEEVARPEAVPQGHKHHGDGKGEKSAPQPLQSGVRIPVITSVKRISM